MFDIMVREDDITAKLCIHPRAVLEHLVGRVGSWNYHLIDVKGVPPLRRIVTWRLKELGTSWYGVRDCFRIFQWFIPDYQKAMPQCACVLSDETLSRNMNRYRLLYTMQIYGSWSWNIQGKCWRKGAIAYAPVHISDFRLRLRLRQVYSTKIYTSTISGLHEFLRNTNNTIVLIYK